GGGGGGGAPPPPLPPAPPPVQEAGGVTVTVTVTERQTVPAPTDAPARLETTSSGSTARMTVPAGAIPGATEVTLGVISDIESLLGQAPPGSVTGIVLAFHVEAKDANGNAITTNFDEPVELEFVVPLSSLPANVTTLDLTVAFWNVSDWVEVPVTIQANDDGTVTLTALVDHFTIFGVAYRPGMRFFAQPLRPQSVTFGVWGGGTIADATRSDLGRVTSLWLVHDGRWRGYNVGSPGVVNQPFRSLFPRDHIPANTPIVVVTK
ncbi:MAG: hypothetical protein O2924_03420, partial [Chloroflexi bacterium]|nr:hypothetical protein [Chloroflexota bacterium]